MESSARVLRFGSDKPMLEAPAMIAIAVAVAAFLAWVITGTEEPTFIDLATWVVVGGFAAIVIGYTGTWQEVVVDATTRQITERYGFLRYRWNWMGQQLKFADITSVVVEQKTTKETVAKSSTSQGTRTVYRKSYSLSLARADTIVSTPERQIAVPHSALELPMKKNNDPLVFEVAARELARLGGWPALRRGYTLEPDGTVKSVLSNVESPINAE